MKKFYILSLFSLVVFAASCDKIDEFLGEGDGGMANDTVPITQDVSAELSMQDVDDLIARAPAPGGDPVSADDIVDLDGDPSTPNSDFTTEIAVVGDVVEFSLTPPDNMTTVTITQILWKDDGSVNYFEAVEGNPKVLVPVPNDPANEIRGAITSDPRGTGTGIIGVLGNSVEMNELPGTIEEAFPMNYSFIFTLTRGGVDYGPYIIDPKMRARQSR